MSEEIYEITKDADGLDCYIKRGEVVRCKDCLHRNLFSCPLEYNDFKEDDDYCAWGERREP